MVEKNKESGEIGGEEFKISQESAERQFNVFLRYYDISFSDIEITDGEKVALTMKNTLIRSIRRGRLQIELCERKVQITHKLDFSIGEIDKIVYRDKVSIARAAVNKSDDEADPAAVFMGVLSGLPPSEFIKFCGADATVYSRLSAIFSMV